LLLAQMCSALVSRRVETAEVALDGAGHALAGAPGMADEPFEPSAGRAASQLANIPAAVGRADLLVLHGDVMPSARSRSATRP
jgi:LuxR family transcriptional regulator, maltose regulon positive regulatory protein